ncbi:AraC family transcriptional regulator [Acinetobacter sp. IRS14]|uniref:AraC family transcriptional regulator n=1 Tax=Acinetobacter sp. IRS14 TaxID=2983398 RepID=UPI002B000423|nr:AraC family transcriptional regulator ligand-binding domain-containing protein [Acinetobacter sp. IRS14]MEA1229541.1 AraC family transcriptional regulator [Acinetobacter sp. IRS14]
MKDPFGLFQQKVSISYALLLLEITSECDLTSEQVLENTGLTVERLRQPEAKMSAIEWVKLVLNALRLTNNPHLGIEYGSRLRPTSHGALGFAFLSCADIETVLNLMTTYFCTRIQSFSPSWNADNHYVYIYLDDLHPIEMGEEMQSHQLRCFLIESLLYGIIHFLGTLAESFESECEIFVDWAPLPIRETDSKSSIPVHFNCLRNSIRFPKKYLTHKNPQADHIAYEQAIQYCENDKAKVTGNVFRDIQKNIRAELTYKAGNTFPSFATIAKCLNMSERSLTRHLQQQGTNFSTILAEVRFKKAKELLQLEQYDVQDVANLVGYNETTNFIRAFRKLFGETPHQFKKRMEDRKE